MKYHFAGKEGTFGHITCYLPHFTGGLFNTKGNGVSFKDRDVWMGYPPTILEASQPSVDQALIAPMQI